MSSKLALIACLALVSLNVEVQGCAYMPGYVTYTNYDHWGDDITNLWWTNYIWSVWCAFDARCIAYNNGGWMKTTAYPLYWAPGLCLRVLTAYAGAPTVCPPMLGYTALPDVDHIGDNITQVLGLNATAAACTADLACLGFNSAGLLKSVVHTLHSAPGNCLYTKDGFGANGNTPVTPAAPGAPPVQMSVDYAGSQTQSEAASTTATWVWITALVCGIVGAAGAGFGGGYYYLKQRRSRTFDMTADTEFNNVHPCGAPSPSATVNA